MKKILLISVLGLIALCLIGCEASTEAEAPSQPIDLSHLSPELSIPPALPSTIQDSRLLEAWIRLYNHHDPIQLWDGSTLTGQDLAQYVLDHAIPVVLDEGHICGDGSCSVRYCTSNTCAYEDGKPGVDPIYVFPAKATDMQSLVDTLAHEIFHRTEPFGAVADTRFEEYWAFWVGAQISKAAWPSFGAYDPLVPEHLNLWIGTNNIGAYFQLQEYPATVALLVQSASGSADPFSGIPAVAYSISP